MRSTHREMRCSVLAYWKFESISLQQTVWSLAGIRLSPSRSRAFRRCCGPEQPARSAETGMTRRYGANGR